MMLMFWLELIIPPVSAIGGLFVFYKILKNDIRDVKNDVRDLKNDVRDVKKDINNSEGRLTKYVDEVKNDLTKTINEVKTDLTKTIDEVKTDLKTANKSLSDVREKVSGIDATLKNMRETIVKVRHYWPPYPSRDVEKE